jgi:hypothetical protein
MYDITVKALLDEQIPVSTKTCRRRPSNVWFDDECRRAKKSLRACERTARRTKQLLDDTIPAVASWRDARRKYFNLLHQKRSIFWRQRVDSERHQPHRLWSSFNEIMGRGQAVPTEIDASTLHRFFDKKIADVRAATAGATPPVFNPAPPGCELCLFSPITEDDVIKLVLSLPDKQCSSDPLPTRLIKANIDLLAPFLCRLFCWSLENGCVPSTLKSAYITPIIKKAGLDPTDLKSYRPISNLSVVSKLLERLVAKQLLVYLKDNGLLPDLQSAYLTHRSTETAVLKVLSDILMALDSGNLAVLMMLDLSAAFDSVDHSTLLQRLKKSYGVSGTVLGWFSSYLDDRSQCVRCSKSTSATSKLLYGVPQGSVLGPILFILYTADLLQLVKRHQLLPHAYADDTQIYGFCVPSETNSLIERISTCFDSVSEWMMANRLQLNPQKTEVMWCSSARRQDQVPLGPVLIGNTSVPTVSSVRNLGVHINSHLTLSTHVTAIVKTCFAVLRQIRSVRRSLTRDALITLIRALVISKVDYCNSVMAGASGILVSRLQSVLNAAARLIFAVRKSDRITPLLRDLHWLKVRERIKFRLCVLAYHSLHSTAPAYIAESLHLASSIEGRRRLRSTADMDLLVPATHCSTLGDRSFPVAAARAWNTLPSSVRLSPSLNVFRRRLKTELFLQSYPTLT